MDRKRKLLAADKAIKRARATLRATRAGPLRLKPFRGRGFSGRAPPELKTIDSSYSTNIPAAGIINLIDGVSAGTDFTNRIGRKIVLKSMLCRFNLTGINTQSTTLGDTVRVMVFYDNQTNGAVPVVGDVLSTGAFMDPINLNNRDRFKVLSDQFVELEGTTYTGGALTAGSPKHHFHQIFMKVNLEEIFSGTGSTVASIATGGVFVLLISQRNNFTNADVNTRIRFNDS